jgi:hypothetical protein
LIENANAWSNGSSIEAGRCRSPQERLGRAERRSASEAQSSIQPASSPASQQRAFQACRSARQSGSCPYEVSQSASGSRARGPANCRQASLKSRSGRRGRDISAAEQTAQAQEIAQPESCGGLANPEIRHL